MFISFPCEKKVFNSRMCLGPRAEKEESNSDEELVADPAQRYRPPWAARILSELLGTYLVARNPGKRRPKTS